MAVCHDQKLLRPSSLVLAASALSVAWLLAGCGVGERPCQVQGEVSYRGWPLKQGLIRFYPTEENQGPGGFTTITDGRYEVPATQPMFPGKHRVSVMAYRQSKVRNPETGEIDEQYLPSEYNNETKLTADLQPGSNTHNLEL